MKFIVNRGAIKMLELIDRSPKLQRMVWAIIKRGSLIGLIHVCMPLLIRWLT